MKETSEQQFSGLGADVVANWRLVAGRKALASEKDLSSPLRSGVAFSPQSEALGHVR